jgi:nucleotide-binding universal stress UspA family protein
MFQRILVAFDGSAHAQRALAEAIDLARTNSGSLTVMTAVPEPSVWTGYEGMVAFDELDKQLESEYRSILDAAVALCPTSSPSPPCSSTEPPARRSSMRPVSANTI